MRSRSCPISVVRKEAKLNPMFSSDFANLSQNRCTYVKVGWRGNARSRKIELGRVEDVKELRAELRSASISDINCPVEPGLKLSQIVPTRLPTRHTERSPSTAHLEIPAYTTNLCVTEKCGTDVSYRNACVHLTFNITITQCQSDLRK